MCTFGDINAPVMPGKMIVTGPLGTTNLPVSQTVLATNTVQMNGNLSLKNAIIKGRPGTYNFKYDGTNGHLPAPYDDGYTYYFLNLGLAADYIPNDGCNVTNYCVTNGLTETFPCLGPKESWNISNGGQLTFSFTTSSRVYNIYQHLTGGERAAFTQRMLQAAKQSVIR